MIFKKFFVATSVGTIGSAFIGIWMAYKGYGVWALVTQQLTNTAVDTIMLWITVKWRPILKFSFNRLKGLFNFGWKILCSAILETFYNELYGLTIGKFYTTEQLAYYNKANQFPKLIMSNIDGTISSVMLPALANEQDNKEKIKAIMKRAIRTSSFILFPMIFGLIAVSEPFVRLILTDKWLPAVPLMQLLCFSYILWPMNSVNLQAISAVGRSDIYLKLEIIKKVIGITTLLVSLPFGMTIMVAMKSITPILAAFINSYPNKKLLNYSFKEQFKDLMPALVLSIIMCISVYLVGTILNINLIINIIIEVSIGIIIYIGLAYLLKLEILNYLTSTIRKKFKYKIKETIK